MKLIIANWKLNPATLREANKIVGALAKVKTKNKVVICPPAPYIGLLDMKHALGGKLALGCQNIFWEENGAHTGQVSSSMVKQFGVRYALVGHSEVRSLGETDYEVNLKLKAAIAAKIVPVLCLGFGLEYGMHEGDVMAHLHMQAREDLAGIDPEKVVLAYEPVWAISSGNGQASHVEMSAHAERIAMSLKIKFKVKKVLYGGSTSAANYASFLDADIDGLLVGGASLRPEFAEMVQYGNR
jgi:triosephosphate isomerase